MRVEIPGVIWYNGFNNLTALAGRMRRLIHFVGLLSEPLSLGNCQETEAYKVDFYIGVI